MSRPGTARLKVNPPLGSMPVLQFCAPDRLRIDESYQRSLEAENSKSLIRKIAQHWNWDLCQPLVVARRSGGELFVIDGQHRLAAANLRGDIAHLPCVVVEYDCAADEAASFVHLNQQRRPLSKLDLFKAAIASEDEEACAIMKALNDAGLSVAPHSNHTAWKPGMVSNIGGIERAWRTLGSGATRTALGLLARAFEGQVLRYCGTIFPGIAAVCHDEVTRGIDTARIARLQNLLGGQSQQAWRAAMVEARARDPNLKFAASSERVIREAWRSSFGIPKRAGAAIDFPGGDRAWCAQCERRVSRTKAEACASKFCSFRKAA